MSEARTRVVSRPPLEALNGEANAEGDHYLAEVRAGTDVLDMARGTVRRAVSEAARIGRECP